MSPNLAQVIRIATNTNTPIPKDRFTPGNDNTGEYSGLLEDLGSLDIEDYKTLATILKSTAAGEVDDDELLLERMVTLLAKLPAHSREGKNLTDGFINTLWNALEHPPAQVQMGNSRYREADGSNNNLMAPMMGAANTPYARTTPAKVFQGPNLPDPGLIFDSIMTRGDGSSFREHPNRISSMLFYLAIIITHDIFQTDPKNKTINLTSSYLDLSPLYGRNKDEQATIRTFKDGLLKPDCFSSRSLLGFPPGVGVFLIMFNRFHNHVVTQLAKINEGGRFNKPNASQDESSLKEAWIEYDNTLFQTGRLITCGLYVNIILKDYVRTILNLNRTGSTWVLDPRTQERRGAFNSTPAPMATGNRVSVEFNLIYRWHSATSKRDEDWTSDLLKKSLGGANPSAASPNDLRQALWQFDKSIPAAPEERELAGLLRRPDKTYSDDDLASILVASIEDVAGAFGANQVPEALRVVEILGINQAREWHAATLNELRQYFGLKKHATFEDINPDPVVAGKLRALYDSPDSVELYPGLVAEKPKPPMPGSGLCVNFTTSQAILSDAVALVRGDRFYTTDYTPTNLTNWGCYQGHVMYKLILCAFPNHFANDSVYAHFPFVVAAENKIILDTLKTASKYSWRSPSRKEDVVVVKSYNAISKILRNEQDFYMPWEETVSSSASPPSKFPGRGSPRGGSHALKSRRTAAKCFCEPEEWRRDVKHFFDATIKLLLKESGQKMPPISLENLGPGESWEVDIVRDVITPLTTRFIAEFFGIPIKSAENMHRGIYTEYELYELLVATFTAVFFDSDPANSFKLRGQARELALSLEQSMSFDLGVNEKASWISNIVSLFSSRKSGRDFGGKDAEQRWPSLPHHGRHLRKDEATREFVTNTVIPVSAVTTALMSGLLSQCVDYFLGDGSDHLPELYRLAHEDTSEADNQLMHYMLEGIRLKGAVVISRCVTPTSAPQAVTDDAPCLHNPSDDPTTVPLPTPDRVTSTTRTYSLVPGQRAVLDLTTASHDAAAFPSPKSFRLDRPLSSYLLPWGFGSQESLGEGVTQDALAAAFKVIFGLPGLRRAPGPRGECKSVEFREWCRQAGHTTVKGGGERTGLRAFMTADQSSYSAIPTTMRVRWDFLGC
ncbi:linoleate diol synthase precursor [Biscogniauxia mediterranea]|nr:linoleate diol synthase precursor [Biscogniauxia mediterranea]